jgi:hypothetical protein|nr:MAG TPA: RNAseH-like protein [Ackermannviridae sp.]
MSKLYAWYNSNVDNGIDKDWNTCKERKALRYKSFKTLEEAKLWLENGAKYEKPNIELNDGVYFDSGTGRGRGVTEVRVTDKDKNSLLNHLITPKFEEFLKSKGWKINEFNNIELDADKSNNYGELLGMYLALEIARKLGYTDIYGDSKLVIYYWSKGSYNELPKETVKLIEQVTKNRKSFGGNIRYINGDYNPADLGFHK